MGMLLNNICYYFNLNDYISYTFDLLVGNSIIVIILLYMASYIKDTIDDVDASSETTFRRWMATMIGNGIPIDWYEII